MEDRTALSAEDIKFEAIIQTENFLSPASEESSSAELSEEEYSLEEPEMSRTDDVLEEYKKLTINYFVEDKGKRVPLVSIELEDTEPYKFLRKLKSTEEKIRFYFYYHPLKIVDDEGNTEYTLYGQIDLIVYSSVRVTINRHTENQEKYRTRGFREIGLESRNRQSIFSPVNPRITMRRVHRKSQVPMIGSYTNIRKFKSDFGFYLDGHNEESIAINRSLSDVLNENEKTDANNRFNIAKSWVSVLFEEEYAAFVFAESSYKLFVYDQHYDVVDGNTVVLEGNEGSHQNSITLDDAVEKYNKATHLISHPKFFDYQVFYDMHPKIVDRGGKKQSYTIPFSISLLLDRSGNILMTGTRARSGFTDPYTNRLLAALPERTKEFTDYRDFLPRVALGKSIKDSKGLGNIEKDNLKMHYIFKKDFGTLFMELTFSVAIGFVPVAGEAFDLFELYKAYNDSEDAFGNRMTDKEKIITAIALLIPIVSSGLLRRGVNFAGRSFNTLREAVKKHSAEFSKLRGIIDF